MRTYYSEYIKHCMRFYSRSVINSPSEKPRFFKSDADKKNWTVCDIVIKSYPENDRETLLTIYSQGDTLADNIYEYAKSKNVNQDAIWNLVNDMERKIAKRRGLL